jgi:hypothetical protein
MSTAIDSSWDHHRNAEMQTVGVFDCISGRIIDFEIVVKKANLNKGNFEGISNGMEIVRFKRLLPRRLHDPNVRDTR